MKKFDKNNKHLIYIIQFLWKYVKNITENYIKYFDITFIQNLNFVQCKTYALYMVILIYNTLIYIA